MRNDGLSARVFSEFAHEIVRGVDVDAVLVELTHRASCVLDGQAACVHLANGRALQRAATNNAVAERLAHLEETLEEGPCVAVCRDGEQFAVDALDRAVDRWPRLAPAVLSVGASAVLSVPLRCADRTIGALSVWTADARAWRPDEATTAQTLADMATSHGARVQALDEAKRVNHQLQHALETRVVIEQAKGIIAGRNSLDIPKALELLRGYARDHNRKLHEVAREVIAGDLDL